MDRFFADLKQHWSERPLVWDESGAGTAAPAPGETPGTVLVVGPHPDDPETAAVLCRLFLRAGHDMYWTIACMSPKGVQDDYARARIPGDEERSGRKIAIRRQEQRRAAELFGLQPERLVFLELDEDKGMDTLERSARLREHVERVSPDALIAPCGQDTNRTHRWVHGVCREAVRALGRQRPRCALWSEDPKTTAMRRDLFVVFGEQSAEWKGSLLRAHDSQQQRNLQTRGVGFDDRILEVNRRSRAALDRRAGSAAFAECYELELFEPE